MDRLQAVQKFLNEHSTFIYGRAHCVIEDSNIDDYWIYSAITNIASDLANEKSKYDMPVDQAIIALNFLVGLLDLPLPIDWEDEDA